MRVGSALPPDVRRWLCPVVERSLFWLRLYGFLTMSILRAKRRTRALPPTRYERQRRGEATASHQAAKPNSRSDDSAFDVRTQRVTSTSTKHKVQSTKYKAQSTKLKALPIRCSFVANT